jgi:hypothetical protein
LLRMITESLGPERILWIDDLSQVKEDEMGRACNTNGEKGNHIGYWWKCQKERDH